MGSSADPLTPRDRIVDVTIVLAVLAAMLIDAENGEHGSGVTVLGTLMALGASLPLLMRRRSPLGTLVAVTPFVFGANATLESYDAAMFAPAVALYSIARYGERRRSIIVALAVTPVIIAGVALTGTEIVSGITLENLAWALLAIAAGDAVRSRRAATADLEQRRVAELREAEAEADKRVAEERLQIAREVHDVVAHSMVAINVQAGSAAHLIGSHPEQAEQALREIKRVSGAALTDLRSTLGLIREDGAPVPVRPAGRFLEPGEIGELAQPLRAGGVEVEVEFNATAEEISSAVGGAAYRIVQEALTNVVRHASASRARVRVAVVGDTLDVEVVDDGVARVAPVANGSTGGNGLRGMAERAAAFGGTVESGRTPEGGWRVHAALPLRTP